jgi:hypothetical protein
LTFLCCSLQITALKNLGLNIRKAALKPGSKASKLFVTDATTSEKILKSSRLEEIRMTIINNMLYYHPVSESRGQAEGTSAWVQCV